MDKLAELKRLGALRRASTPPEGSRSLGSFHNGYYETDFVSPWTKSACNVDANLALVLQYWCSSDYLEAPKRPIVREMGHDPNFPSNKHLAKYLARMELRFGDTFGTNAFPWIKTSQMTASMERNGIGFAVEEFLLPQLKIIGPKATVLLGKTVSSAVRSVLGLPKLRTLEAHIEEPFEAGSTRFFTVALTGSRMHLHRDAKKIDQDWRRISDYLAK